MIKKAGCSFLFLLPECHTDTFGHYPHDGLTYLLNKCYALLFSQFSHHIRAMQNGCRTYTIQTLHLSYAFLSGLLHVSDWSLSMTLFGHSIKNLMQPKESIWIIRRLAQSMKKPMEKNWQSASEEAEK